MNPRSLLPLCLSFGLTLFAADGTYTPPRKNLGFPIYTNQPAGKQLAGQHVAASTPALSPEDARKKFTLPEGFEMRLFACEPEIVNPVAMTWDERGRLWVVELYEYPLGAKPGEKGRDRIKILEDTDADGKADKVTVFAEGFSLATGLALGNGGVILGQAPELLFLEDTNGDDKADKRTVLKTGFGLDDRHELLNGFVWGPDGWLYMTHGVFTHSKVRDPNYPNDTGVVANAAVARFHPKTKKFEVFADGTSNPWGVDFDRAGNAFVSACVIDHMFHLSPGGIYVRQGGTPANPYAYQLLPSIVDHRHHMAAYAGVQVYQGNQYPKEYLGTILIGNIHDNAIHQDRLTPNGSTFKSSFIQDFVRANDGWFMPVSSQIGPDGALWIMDWYDKYPCYQNARADPDGVDREHGRIWRVVYTGKEKGKAVASRQDAKMDLKKSSSSDLIKLLEHPNVWQRRMAQRLLSERADNRTKSDLVKLATSNKPAESRLSALWTLHGSGLLDEATLDKLVTDKDPTIRTWVARLTGERGNDSDQAMERLKPLVTDSDPSVRLAVAVACRQFVSGSLTVDTPAKKGPEEANISLTLQTLAAQPGTASDPLLPFMIWMAGEPVVRAKPQYGFDWLVQNSAGDSPLISQFARKIMRIACDLGVPENMNGAIQCIASLSASNSVVAVAALDGLLEGQRGKALIPSTSPSALINQLLSNSNPEVKSRAQKLGSLWGDAAALQATVKVVNDANASVDERIKAVQTVRQLKSDAARDAMVLALAPGNPEALIIEAIRGLAETGSDLIVEKLLAGWKSFSPAARRAAAETLASRDRWASNLLSAIERKDVPPSDIPAATIRTLTRSQADYGMLAKRAAQIFGKVRDADTDKLKIIAAKKKFILSEAKPNLESGHELAKKTCFVCHKLHGEGAEVGPDLTGVGRSTLDALLANVIDPNQIIGAGYEMVEVETKDGRSVSGRMVENNDARVRLLSAGPKEDIVAKSDIANLRVSQISLMPEGLEQMPDEDFRNLIAYILNPPGDKQPFSWKNDVGHGETPPPKQPAKKKAASVYPPIDHESVALWNPEWTVIAPDFQGSPQKLVEYAGRRNVLMTHPFDKEKPAALERDIEVPAGRTTILSFSVAPHEKGDWELHVLANGSLIQKRVVEKGSGWKPVSVNLSQYAGKKVKLRLENSANGWSYEFGYWSDLQVKSEVLTTAR